MKIIKLFGALCFILFVGNLAMAQKEKIKGNRDVTIKQTYLDSFNTLIVKDNFEIKLAFNSKPSIEIVADDNLHNIIDTNVSAGVLTISTNKRIASKKKLEITVNYANDLSNIQLLNDSEIRSLTSLELENVELNIEENARAYLNLKSALFKFSASGRSKSRLNITADSTSFIMSDNSKLDALLNGKVSSFDIYQSADANIEGVAEGTTLRLDNSSKFEGKNYTVKNADVLIESNSDLTLNVETLLKLKASGSSETYIYGEPKIDLELFTGTSKLQKKK